MKNMFDRWPLREGMLCALGLLLTAQAALNTAYWYVRPAYWWVLLAAGLCLVAFSLWHMLAPKPTRRGEADADMHDAHDEVPPRRLTPVHLVLLLPLAAAVFMPGPVAPQQIHNDVNHTPDIAATADGGAWQVWTLLRAVADNHAPTGQALHLTGQVAFDHTANTWQFTQVRIVCCAADAVRYGIDLAYPPAQGIREGDWVEFHGTLELYTAARPQLVGVVVPIPTPERPYQ